MIVVTGATGHLGQLVIEELLKTIKSQEIIALARDPEKAKNLSEKGVNVRKADYNNLESLKNAFKGANKILLISSSEVGQRLSQHQKVIEAAKEIKPELFVYTSILKVEESPLALAQEHLATEKLIKESGLSYTILRNGWYLENYTDAIINGVKYGAILGSAKEGRVSAATRKDYAQAAAKVLTTTGHMNKIYELAGSHSFNLTELANKISALSGKPVSYENMPENAYAEALIKVGLPEGLAKVLADSDVGMSRNGLFSDRKDLANLIGRETTTLESFIKQIL